MAITNKLITFNKLTSFETQLAAGNILSTSIVFIKDAKKIWTKGTYFDCSGIPIIEGLEFESPGTLNEEQLAVLSKNPIMFIVVRDFGEDVNSYLFIKFVQLSTITRYKSTFGNVNFILTISDNHYSVTQTDLALKSDIGYTTEFSVADIEAVYGRGITKPINVAGLISAIEANRPIIIPTDITDTSNVGGNAVTMAKMVNDGFIYLNVIVPYLDGIHKEYFIQIQITTAQLVKSGITLKELISKTDLKTINGESILGNGDIAVQGGEDNKYFTEFTVDDFINACKNESSLVSNGLCDAIINNKIICVPYSLESYNRGYLIASCNYNYSEDLTDSYNFNCIIERYQITYNLVSSGSVANNDTFWGLLPTSACSQVVYLDSLMSEFQDNITYIISPYTHVNEFFIPPVFYEKGTTIRFITGDNPSLEFVSNVLWANGVIPEIEPNTWYELSLTTTEDENILAVLTPFKSV